MTTQRVLVTGAGGRIGRTVMAHLGNRAVCIDQADADLVSSRDLLAALMQGCDAVIHLAADPSPEASFRSAADNLRMVLNVLEAAEDGCVRRAILASSVWADHAAFGISTHTPPYAASKRASEEILRGWVTEDRCGVALRFGAYDPEVRRFGDEVEVLRLSDAGLCHWTDRALSSPPGYTVWNAIGAL